MTIVPAILFVFAVIFAITAPAAFAISVYTGLEGEHPYYRILCSLAVWSFSSCFCFALILIWDK